MSNCQPKNLAIALFYFCSVIMCIILIGCGTKQNEAEKTETNEQDAAIVSDDVLKSLRSSQVTDLVRFSDDVLDEGLLNNVDRANHYLSKRDKGAAAVNLGIYMSDLSCLMAHGKREEASRYFQACLSLSEFIGMKKQFIKAIQLHFNEIISGDEKLKKSMDELFKDASNIAEQEAFKKLHAAALAGYYIEELYLLASFVKSHHAPDRGDSIFFATLGVFASQKDELNNLITHFDHVQLKSAGISAYQELLTLQERYWAMDTDRFWSQQKTNPELVLNDKTLQEVFETLFSLRKRIIDF
jgi:hypothetical protein